MDRLPSRAAGPAPPERAAARSRRCIRGIGFTVSLLIASLAFSGPDLEEAKLGALCSVVLAPLIGGACCASSGACRQACERGRSRAPQRTYSTCPRRSIQSATTSAGPKTRLSRSSSTATSSARTADRPSRCCASCSPHPRTTSGTCGGTFPSTTSPQRAARGGGIRGGGRTGRLLGDARHPARPPGRAERRGCRVLRARARTRRGAHRRCGTAAHVCSARQRGCRQRRRERSIGTPTFFINGRRHYGAYDVATLKAPSERPATAPCSPEALNGRRGPRKFRPDLPITIADAPAQAAPSDKRLETGPWPPRAASACRVRRMTPPATSAARAADR